MKVRGNMCSCLCFSALLLNLIHASRPKHREVAREPVHGGSFSTSSVLLRLFLIRILSNICVEDDLSSWSLCRGFSP